MIDSDQNKSPRSWSEAALGEVASFEMGQAPAGSASNFDGVGTVFVKAGEFGPIKPIVREWTTDPRKFAKEGDVLICVVGATAGKLNLGIDCAIGRSVAAIRPSEALLQKAIYYQLLPNVERMRAASTGSAQGVISQSDLAKLPIRVPPKAEQIRIVEKLEELLSDLDAGVAELKAAQRKLAQYRQSLLKAAVEGALTADWRAVHGQPQETGAELLQRILSERRARWEQKQLAKFAEQGKAPPKGWQAKYTEPVAPDLSDLPPLPGGWTWASVGQLGEVTTGFTPSTSNAEYFGGDIPFFKPTDLDAGYDVREFRESLTMLGVEQGRLLPANSVLVTCIGATIGKTGFARVPCATNQQINAVSPVEEGAETAYLYFVLTSNYGQRQIIGNASATTLPILNKSKFERLPVPVPGKQEQAEIVRQLEMEMGRVAEQEAAIEASLKQVAAQRKNLLRAAFAGQLVPQDPNDEPASELLARIRAERASNDGSAQRRRRKTA